MIPDMGIRSDFQQATSGLSPQRSEFNFILLTFSIGGKSPRYNIQSKTKVFCSALLYLGFAFSSQSIKET